jgi:antitoxin VapB
MAKTKLKTPDPHAVTIPSKLAYGSSDVDLVVAHPDDQLRLRPASRRMGDVLGTLARFPADFMSEGRNLNAEDERPRLDQHE